jgi:hypothetical protein
VRDGAGARTRTAHHQIVKEHPISSQIRVISFT